MITQIPTLEKNWRPFDISMSLAICLIVIHLFFNNPVQLLAGRKVLIVSKEESLYWRCVFSLLYLGLVGVLASFFSNIVVVFSIMGGFISSLVSLFFPMVCHGSLVYKREKRKAQFIIACGFFWVFIGWTAALLGILSTFKIIDIGL